MTQLLTTVILMIAITDRTESTFLSVPPNPFYFTPPEPIVLNWTFSPSNQYRVEFYEYIESWKVWDMIFKSLVWLPRYSYYKYGDRLKFTTQPQSTITYTYSKSEDAGRKRFWLYSYKSDGSFTLEETITEFIVKEAQSTSSLIQPSTYLRYNEDTTTYFSERSEVNKSEKRNTITTSYYATTPLKGETSPVSYDTSLTNMPIDSTKVLTSTAFLQMVTFSTRNSAMVSTAPPATFSSVNPTTFSKANAGTFSTGNTVTFSTAPPATFSSVNPTTFSKANPGTFATANLTTAISSKESKFSSKPLTPSSVVSRMLDYSTHLPYKSSSMSQPRQGSNAINSTPPKSHVTMETKSVLLNVATIDSIMRTSSYVATIHETSSYETSRNLTSSYIAPSPVLSILGYSFDNVSPIQFTSKNANRNTVTSKFSNNVVTRTITGMISSRNKQASSALPVVNSSTASSTVPPQSNNSGKGNTANSKSSWKVGLSIGVPISVVTLLVIAGWFCLAKYKKVSTITPKREDVGMLENGKCIQGLKYRTENNNE